MATWSCPRWAVSLSTGRGLSRARIKTVTIAKEADGWYRVSPAPRCPSALALTGQETGIDVGLKVFLITAGGDVVENPRHYRRAERELQKAQRRVSRRQKGSKRRRKAVQLLARKHQTVQRQRRDFHHKTALQLVQQYDTIYLEDLQVANMVRNPHLAKSIGDAGWEQFQPSSKAKRYMLAVASSPCRPPIPRRTAVAVVHGSEESLGAYPCLHLLRASPRPG